MADRGIRLESVIPYEVIMDSKIPSANPQIVAATTAPRPTPTPVRVKFSEVLGRTAGTFVRGAEAAMKSLPGSPLMAVAVRGGAVPVPMNPMSHAGGFGATAEGPGGNTTAPGAAFGAAAAGAAGIGGVGGPLGASATGTGGAAGGEPGIEGSLAQAQEMNLYYLQIQEQVNAENRTFSTLSNVMKAEHDTVKTAIGNIR